MDRSARPSFSWANTLPSTNRSKAGTAAFYGNPFADDLSTAAPATAAAPSGFIPITSNTTTNPFAFDDEPPAATSVTPSAQGANPFAEDAGLQQKTPAKPLPVVPPTSAPASAPPVTSATSQTRTNNNTTTHAASSSSPRQKPSVPLPAPPPAQPPASMTNPFALDAPPARPALIPPVQASSSTSSSLPPLPAPPTRSDSAQSTSTSVFQTDERRRLMNQIDELILERDKLRQQVKSMQESLLSPTAVVQQLCFGQPCTLSHFRSLSEKAAVLDAAVATLDSNAIMPVVLFMRATLSSHVFHRELCSRKVACALYKNFLKQRGQHAALLTLAQYQQSVREEALLMVRQAFREPTVSRRQAALEACLAFVKPHESLKFVGEQIIDALNLLGREAVIEEHDGKVALSGTDEMYVRYPRRSVLFKPLSGLLYYCWFYHPRAPKNKLSSPENLKQTFHIHDKLYMWTAMRARARTGDWNAFQELATAKKALLSSKPKPPPIGFEPFVAVAAEGGAPRDMVVYLASLIEDERKRYEVACRYRLYELALETLVSSLRDRQEAMKFRDLLLSGLGSQTSAELRIKLEHALQDPKIKWKGK